jgi:uncharacterized membrane protein YeaQ/YmgE (transglycosylase-associated protein family)
MREATRYLLVGIVSAWIASIAIRGRIVRIRGSLPYIVFGISGALAGGYAVQTLGGSYVAAVIASVAGAIAFLMLLQYLRNA